MANQVNLSRTKLLKIWELYSAALDKNLYFLVVDACCQNTFLYHIHPCKELICSF